MTRWTLLAWAAIALATATLTAQGSRTFAGVIADSECAGGDHSAMKMGETNAACTNACVESHGASLRLVEGDQEYELSDQATALPFAGQLVTVKGALVKQRIIVESIEARRP
jgi:hypothetical protein